MPEQKPETEYVDVTIRLPKPPDGWGEPEWREMSCKTDVYLSCNLKWNIVGNSSFGGRLFFCRRIWTPPANAAHGLWFFPKCGKWYISTSEPKLECGNWSTPKSDGICVTAVFADFTEPPERRPYRVDWGVVVKDGAK